MPHPHAITRLTLENFRNYASLTLQLPTHSVVLRGVNGAGKTNILEAISMLAPGRGLRSARLGEMDRMQISATETGWMMSRHPGLVPGSPETGRDLLLLERQTPLTSGDPGVASQTGMTGLSSLPWVVAAHVMSRGEETHIGTGRDGEAQIEKRLIKINGEKVKSHATLAAHTCIQWLTPSMDQVFIEGNTARRKFFDRLVYGFAPEHANRVAAYETAMRERNKILSDNRGRADPYWLSVIEQQMAEHAVAITLARLETRERLAAELAEDIAHFPRAGLRLTGTLEHWLEQEGTSALDAEQKFAERLANNRGMDAARGRATEGCHRSEWGVTHSVKGMEAAQCSTGEQKALILSILLASARARAKWCGMAPILLLDEVIAHLDVDKRACLFDLIRASRIQAWMTGTDAADFKGLEGDATLLEIAGGTLRL